MAAILARAAPIFLALCIGVIIWMIISAIREVQQKEAAARQIRQQIEARGGSKIRVKDVTQFNDKNLFRVQATYTDEDDQPCSHRIHMMRSSRGHIQEIVWLDPLDPLPTSVKSSKEQIITDLSAENAQLRETLTKLQDKKATTDNA
ncbi:MAG: hypothetical protein ACPG8W_14495 [Candidatus Promineifilaceae bacterium]